MHHLSRIALALILGVALAACGPKDQDYDPTLYPDNDPSRRFIGFGDSLTAGSPYSSGWSSYAARVSEVWSVRLVNAGKGGSRIADDGQIGRIKRMEYRPDDVVLFLSGYNDMRFYGAAGITQYKEKLREALGHLNPKVQFVFLGTCLRMPNYLTVGGWSAGSDAAAEAFRDAAIEVAADFSNVIVVDTTSLSLTPDKFMDTVHPTYSGLLEIAQVFLSAM